MTYDWTSYCCAGVSKPFKLAWGKTIDLPLVCGRKEDLFTIEIVYNDGSKAQYGYCREHRDGQLLAYQAHPVISAVNCWERLRWQ